MPSARHMVAEYNYCEKQPRPKERSDPGSPVSAEQTGQMTHREVLEALSGLLLAMFVAMLSSTIVSNALPTIVDDLEGSQTGYTWVVVATMLAMTATTPIWGKFADLFDKKACSCSRRW